MCTTITNTTHVQGAGRGATGWFDVNTATVAYDHPSHGHEEHALLLDFANYDLGTNYRVALELDLASGKALLAQLQQVIAEAEAAGV
jgi:hypothetical protein